MRRTLDRVTTATLASVLAAAALSGCTPRYERMVRVTPESYGTARPEVVMSFEGEDMADELSHLDEFRVFRSDQRLTGSRLWTAEPESRRSPTEVPATVRGQQLVLDVDDLPEGVHELWAEWDGTTTQNNAQLVVDLQPPAATFEPPRPRGDLWELEFTESPGVVRGEVTMELEGLAGVDPWEESPTGGMILVLRPTGPDQAVVLTDRGGNVTRLELDLPFPR